jgi:integrase
VTYLEQQNKTPKKDAGVIEHFLDNFTSIQTIKGYRSMLNHYFKTLGINNPNKYVNNGRNYNEDIKTYAKSIKELPPLSQKTRIACIKSFLIDNDIDVKLSTWKSINNRIPKGGPVTDNVRPTNEQLKQILAHTDVKSKALFLLISSSGMRITETLKLTFDDIDTDNRKITIKSTNAKNNNKCITFFTEEAKEALLEWLKVRDEFLRNSYYKSKFVRDSFAKKGITFTKVKEVGHTIIWKITKDRKEITDGELFKEEKRIFPFSSDNAIKTWNLLLEKSGLNEKETDDRLKHPRYKFHIHTLRKFFTTNMEDDGVPMSFIDKYTNHKQRYNGAYVPRNEQELKDMYDAHCNCLTVFSNEYKVQKEIKPKLQAQDTAITELMKKNKQLEQQLSDLTKIYEYEKGSIAQSYEQKLNLQERRIQKIEKLLES